MTNEPGEYDGAELVQEFRRAYPEAYARWFLLEALCLGIAYPEVGNELNEFLWGRFGKSSHPLIHGGMAMRVAIYSEARAFLDKVIADLPEDQWLDVTRLMEGYSADRNKG